MTKNIKFVGLDVHAATVAIAVAETGGEVRSLGKVAHEVTAIVTSHLIGLEEISTGVWSVYLGNVLLARIAERDFVVRG